MAREPYSLQDHRFRFATWACTHAISRGIKGATWLNVHKLLKSTGLQQKIDRTRFSTDAEFDSWHAITVTQLRDHGKAVGISNMSFGIAAKILAIFIKVMYIIPGERQDLLKHGHPPLDRIVLMNSLRSIAHNQSLSWTKFDKRQYYAAFKLITKESERTNYRWELERHWHPN